jgi:hypothetical protein
VLGVVETFEHDTTPCNLKSKYRGLSVMQIIDAVRQFVDVSKLSPDIQNLEAISAPLQPLPSVRGLLLYGYTLFDRFISPPGWKEGINNAGKPVLVALGDGDVIASNISGTFDRLLAPKASILLKGLDHFSIADNRWLLRANETPSVLPREEQISPLALLTDAWFRFLDVVTPSSQHPEHLHKLHHLPGVWDAAGKFVTSFAADLRGIAAGRR